MAKLVTTIYETTADAALQRTAEASALADLIEIRADRFSQPGEAVDFAAFRRSTRKPLLLTRRSVRAGGGQPDPHDLGESRRAIAAGFDLIDVEFSPSLDLALLAPILPRVILSHHDFRTVCELRSLVARMRDAGAAHVKIAATPRKVEDNYRLLEILGEPGLTVLGMGARGLYARVLAPLFGSEFAFVSAGAESAAAPGQFDAARGREIWGDLGAAREPEAIFAIAGHPATHSLSPGIHNRMFRDFGTRAAYSILDVERFEEAGAALAAGGRFAPRGLSITAPFKQDAYRFAKKAGAQITERAELCGAINTIVRMEDGSYAADLTDIDGFSAAIARLSGRARRAAILGSGSSARTAIVALQSAGLDVHVFARRPEALNGVRAHSGVLVFPLDQLESFEGEVVVNAISAEAEIEYPRRLTAEGKLFVDLAYTAARARQLERVAEAGAATFGGIEFLEAQAVAQNRMFRLAAGSHPPVSRPAASAVHRNQPQRSSDTE